MDVLRKIRQAEAAAGQGAALERQRPSSGKRGTFVDTLERMVARPAQGARRLLKTSAQKVEGAGQSVGRAIGRMQSRPALRNITLTQAARLAYFAPVIQRCSAKYGVPVPLICGVMLQESGGNPNAVSHCGARGLMQLMPATARRMGVTNIMDPRQNIEGGVRYLRYLLDRFRGNVRLSVAAYNCGEGNIDKYGGRIPPFRETQAYVPNVLAFAETVHHVLGGRGMRLTTGGTARQDGASPAGWPGGPGQPPSGPSLAGRFVKLA